MDEEALNSSNPGAEFGKRDLCWGRSRSSSSAGGYSVSQRPFLSDIPGWQFPCRWSSAAGRSGFPAGRKLPKGRCVTVWSSCCT